MDNTLDQISGAVEAIVFTQTDSGFTVARLKESKKKDVTTIVGTIPSLQPGETIRCKGTWKIHPSHGKQFEVAEYVVEMPSDLVGIQKYLESGLVKGIGPVYAKRIVDRFGLETLDIIEHTPHKLGEIDGMGPKKIEKVKKSWAQQKGIRDVMIFLRGHGVSPAYAQRIFKVYGVDSIEKVKANPYQLAKDIFGIGFKLADTVAQKLGFAIHSPERLAAGIQFVLWELSGEGHTCFPKIDFLPIAQQMLEVDLSLIEKEIDALVESKQLVQKGDLIWLAPFFAYEMGISKDFIRIQSTPQAIRPIDTEKAIIWVQEKLHIELAEQQKQAVMRALTDKVHIITGGPGTGKSTITNAILTITRKLTDQIFLAAPTGRAAKRMSQITKSKALTIHVLLETDFIAGGFKRNKENPLKCDLLIIDEASMIDTALLFHLLRAIPSHARVLFVGDIDQLPSVGPGIVLSDLIHSGRIGVTKLTEIFRQAKGSRIITNAHKINQGEFPSLSPAENSDFHYIEAETPEAISQIILELVSKEIPKRWRFDPIEDIQVLSPMKRGVVGAEILNDHLQQMLNPSHHPLMRSGKRFHLHDKVMQIKNDYNKEVYNGDIGRISHIDIVEEVMGIVFDEREVIYEFSELDQIVLAYATSVHKYQGSECPCIILPVHTSHFKLLYRNLLYTAVTRGKRQVYLVGTKKAIAIAVHNDQVQKRYTGLETAIKEVAMNYQHQHDVQLQLKLY